MKKVFYNLIIVASLLMLITSCEKDNISNGYFDANLERQEKVAQEAKKVLASSETGWVMMAKVGLNSEVYTPIVLKFDTVKNRVFVKTVYGETAETESFFRITNGTGAPQLIFTSGSIMSTLYRIGTQASDITDHMYNIVGVSADTVAIQCYRSGKVYAKEGGVIYKMFKRPKDWKWADGEIYFDMSSPGFTQNVAGVSGNMKIEYINNPSKNKTFETIWSTVAPTNLATMQNGFPFQISRNIGTGGFKNPYYFYLKFPYTTTTNYDVSPAMSNNVMSFYPQSGYTSNLTYMNYFINTYNIHYLTCKSVIRTGNNVKMEFEAYDVKGNVSVKAQYDNLK
ncbi:DUF4302 domain-containing protein [Sphingobacterium tabacisoli]|uniref:DUF4302 domain-containing protein n=1 Tax=Sphingobacterium tabacisoli TaxID=2044855 RepID=A0ABW5KZA6_9SPHI|nr:DUF4302 domain-containing protein [Sphingobacterium tabacisoli]